MHCGNQFLPESHWLGMGIVHAEDLHPLLHPEEHYTDELTPEVLPIIAVEVDRVDVLILLWRIFSITNGAIRPLVKPIGMIFDVRVIRRAVDREIQRDFKTALLRLTHQPNKILNSAQRRLNRLVPTSLATDGPRRPHVILIGYQGIVLALAIRETNGVNGREINHIEAHVLRVIKTGYTIPKSAVFVSTTESVAGEELVPCGEPGALTFNNDRESPGRGGQIPIMLLVQQRLKLFRLKQFHDLTRWYGFEHGGAILELRSDFSRTR